MRWLSSCGLCMSTQKMKSQNLTNLMTPDCQSKRRKRYLYLSTTAWRNIRDHGIWNRNRHSKIVFSSNAETEMIWQICCTGCNALIFAAGNTDRELCAGLDIISKSWAYKINKPASEKEEKANEGEQCNEEQNRTRSQSL